MKYIAIFLIQFYRLLLSPLIPPSCRYFPTCSQYAIEAFRRYGLWGGSMRTVRRLLRCHPWGAQGYDPVE